LIIGLSHFKEGYPKTFYFFSDSRDILKIRKNVKESPGMLSGGLTRFFGEMFLNSSQG
jgi:hypothetical protein